MNNKLLTSDDFHNDIKKLIGNIPDNVVEYKIHAKINDLVKIDIIYFANESDDKPIFKKYLLTPVPEIEMDYSVGEFPEFEEEPFFRRWFFKIDEMLHRWKNR